MTSLRVQMPEALTEISARAFLAQHGISRTLWKRIKHSGTFQVNGESCIAGRTMLKGGDQVSYEVEHTSHILPENLPLSILYEDEALLIVNKPAGQLVHPTTQEHTGTLGNAVMAHYASRGESHACHPVHRLDRSTSGLVLIAKLPQVQYLLTGRDGTKQFQREYLAVCEGTPEPASGLIDAPIARALPSIILRKISPEGQSARTHYETLESRHGLSLLRLKLETGRTHQIRVHLSFLGHPLAGDELYGGSRELIPRQALHAWHLYFRHPLTSKEINIYAPLPPDLLELIKQNGFSEAFASEVSSKTF